MQPTPSPTRTPTKAIVMAGWDDAVHLGPEEKADLLAACEPHLRESRSKGIPHLGSGSIYQVPLEDLWVDPFPIKPWFWRCYGMDVGWNATAAVWGAWDKDTDIVYIYDCYKRGNAEPPIHASAIKRRNVRGTEWTGAIDPASRNRSQTDGSQLLRLYRQEGLKLVEADNAVDSGIYSVWSRLSTGRLKIFKGVLGPWEDEYRIYRRDENGKIVKTNDHLMDATRYMIMTGLKHARPVTAQAEISAPSRNYGF